MTSESEFGQRLADLRARAGLTQNGFADVLGMTRSALGKLERGETTPRYRTLQTLIEVLGIAPAELFSSRVDAPWEIVAQRLRLSMSEGAQLRDALARRGDPARASLADALSACLAEVFDFPS